MSTATEYLLKAKSVAGTGDLLAAYDRVVQARMTFPDDWPLRHQQVLLLARMGATEEAINKFQALALHDWDNDEARTLEARLEKDVALALPAEDPQRQTRLLRTARLYDRAYQISRDRGLNFCYPGVNAATFYLLAGQESTAKDLATDIRQAARDDYDHLKRPTNESGKKFSNSSLYFACATLCEIEMILDNIGDFGSLLSELTRLGRFQIDNVASTRRQLLAIAKKKNLQTDPYSFFKPSRIVLLVGKDEKKEDFLSDQSILPSCIVATLQSRSSIDTTVDLVGIIPIYAILPIDQESYIQHIAANLGQAYATKIKTILSKLPNQNKRVAWSAGDKESLDDDLWAYVDHYALGLSKMIGRTLAPDTEYPNTTDETQKYLTSQSNSTRVRAIMFGDVKGFSKMVNASIPQFVERVWGKVATILKENATEPPEVINTWGDAIFTIFKSSVAAASNMLALQQEITSLAGTDGLPNTLGMRIGGHWGPVHKMKDPLTEQMNAFGVNVNTAARIEPVAEVGTVWITEAFAAALAVDAPDEFRCDYLGRRETAKAFGEMPLYRLRRISKP